MTRHVYELSDGRRVIDCPICGQAAPIETAGTSVRVRCFGRCDDGALEEALRPIRADLLAELRAIEQSGRATEGARATRVGKSRSQLHTAPPEADATPAQLAEWLTAALGTQADPVSG